MSRFVTSAARLLTPFSDVTTAMMQTLDEVVFLRGRPPLGEYINYIQQNDVNGSQLTPAALAAEWREANSRVQELEKTEKGIADSPKVESIAPELVKLVTEFSHDPSVQRSFGFMPFLFGMIDLDQLVVFQKQINMPFIRQLQPEIAEIRTEEEMFRFVFSRSKPTPPVRMARMGPAGFSFVSPSMDFRPLDVAVLQQGQVREFQVGGTLNSIVGVAVGYGSNVLQATRYKGRLLLGNGSHRAYALRAAGKRRVPCLVQEATLEEEVKMTFPSIAEDLGTYFDIPRPPMLKDYFEPKLTRIVQVPRKLRQVRVLLQVEQSDVPG